MSKQPFCPYAVLGVTSTASFEDIKRSYQQLVRTFHPDKMDKSLPQEEQENARQRYFAIDKAWAILCDREKRAEHDRQSKETNLVQEWPVNADVDLDEMEFHEDNRTLLQLLAAYSLSLSESGKYTFACRCSGEFIITEENLENAQNVVCCTDCTLSIRVLYAAANDDENKQKQG